MVNDNGVVIAGLIRGRHDMPVDNYIFDQAITDVHDYDHIRSVIVDFIDKQVGVTTTCDLGINQADGFDVLIYTGLRKLEVYVTGLTCVTAELIAVCARNGIHLTLVNYDSVSGNYVRQSIF